jgi:hypothetical protein
MSNRASTFNAKARENRMTIAIARLEAAVGPEAEPGQPTPTPTATAPAPTPTPAAGGAPAGP